MRAEPVATPSDETLVAAFVEGDDEAFDALVRRYEQRVYAICYRYFGDATDAEDAAQEAFVTLLRRAATFQGSSTFATWMYRVTVNTCNDLGRKRSRRPRTTHAEEEWLGRLAVDGTDLSERLAQRGLDEHLARALMALDAASREAIVLHDVYGVPYTEIAERAGVAVGTVKSRIHRGHARLAGALAERQADASDREPSEPASPPTLEP